jgi:putative molybdopterin biosynthesis protein
MKTRGVQLQYRFVAADHRGAQSGAQVHNPLFELLEAVRSQGSIQRAAMALGLSYRHVWGALKTWEVEIGEPLVHWSKGQPARLSAFAERLLWAEARARARLAPHIEALRHELELVIAEAMDGSQLLLSVWASHDLALPLLQQQSAARGLHLELRVAGSLDALRALAEGRCAVAGFHVPALPDNEHVFAPALKPLLSPGRHKLIGCTRRWQGLMLARGNPLKIGSLADLAKREARFVQRQPGSGTRVLTDHLLALHRVSPSALVGPASLVEDSHLAVAAAVASDAADAGIGIQAAAAAFGLDFLPLIEEDYFLVCLADQLESPAVLMLRQALADAAWAQSLQALPGYQAARGGEVLSLTRALPWWHFKRART